MTKSCKTMRSSGLPRLIPLLLAALPAQLLAQPSGSVAVGGEIDGNARVEADVRLSETESGVVMGSAWAEPSAGGLKLSYHFATRNDEGVTDTVRKYFVGLDQNRAQMRRAVFGLGIETAEGMAGAYVTRRIGGSDRNTVAVTEETASTEVRDGDYRVIDTTLTRAEQVDVLRGFDHSIGVRVGRHFDDVGLSVIAGLDHARGRKDANETALTLQLEKQIAYTPWSVAVRAEAARGDNPATGGYQDERFWLLLRYRFGDAANMTQTTATSAVSLAPAEPPSTRTEMRWVTREIAASREARFGFDSARLSPQAILELEQLAAELKDAERTAPPVEVTGFTCDIGDANYNLALSKRRAASVTSFLVSRGVSDTRITTTGLGEGSPRYPNLAGSRERNRRVEVRYQTLSRTQEPHEVALPMPALPTPVPAEPAWVQRALYSVMPHRQHVGQYATRSTRVSTSTTTERVFDPLPGPGPDPVPSNRAPVAMGDVFVVSGINDSRLDVLANDSDPDGDALQIVSFTQPDAGQISLVDGGTGLLFDPSGIFFRSSFDYIVSDPSGATATAQVVLLDP